VSQSLYKIQLEHFEGPLDLLLQLIENEELDITRVSLAKVTEQFLDYVNQAATMNPEEVADFLVVASKLLLIKSKVLIPTLDIDDEETLDLERQLKIYKEYYEAAKAMDKLIKRKHFIFAREKPLRVFTPRFSPPEKFSLRDLPALFFEVLKKLEPVVNLPQEVIRRTISISEKIRQIKDYIISQVNFSFKKLLNQGGKTEVVVAFLAMLELVKQQTIEVEQTAMFAEIKIKRIDQE